MERAYRRIDITVPRPEPFARASLLISARYWNGCTAVYRRTLLNDGNLSPQVNVAENGSNGAVISLQTLLNAEMMMKRKNGFTLKEKKTNEKRYYRGSRLTTSRNVKLTVHVVLCKIHSTYVYNNYDKSADFFAIAYLFTFNIFGFLSVISTNHHRLKQIFVLHISAYLGKIQKLLHIESKI